jgi:hypothetical protein
MTVRGVGCMLANASEPFGKPRFPNHQPEARYANQLLSMTASELPPLEAIMAVTEPHVWRGVVDAFSIW